MRNRALMVGALASVLTLVASAAEADVFNMPTGQTSLQFVTVGDPGNAPDTVPESDRSSGYGPVPYDYKLGKYDVTIAQYCQFLNAVAAVTDTYDLYSIYMAPGSQGGFTTLGIGRTGSLGKYSYSVAGSYSQAANCPAFCISWGDAARFCNWLQNGQPTGREGNGTTETGAYTLNGDMGNFLETRNAGAVYFIPSANEWYKAAYYNPAASTYWWYPTQSDAAPSNVLDPSGTNNANYNDAWLSPPAGNGGFTDPTNYMTPVGAFAASPGPYGTYDMGGDVYQWTEGLNNVNQRFLGGGDWYGPPEGLLSDALLAGYAFSGALEDGFRVAAADPGDANGDGAVDINDLTIVLANFGRTGCAWSQGCMDGDPTGTVDINDLTIVLANFGTTAGSGIQAVPEPSGVILCAIGAISLLGNGWRRRAS